MNRRTRPAITDDPFPANKKGAMSPFDTRATSGGGGNRAPFPDLAENGLGR